MGVLIGFLINLQFFTAIPIKRELPIEDRYIRRAIQTFPLAGLLLGGILSGAFYVLSAWLPFSAIASAFIIWLLTIVLTGGLHLDGWMDASDAYFSYRDRTKRLEIMKDPRTGAFGVLSVIVLLSARYLFIYEIVQKQTSWTFLLILLIPFIGKMVMGLVLARAPLAKPDGLAVFFQKSIKKGSLQIYWVYIFLALILGWFYARPLFLGICIMGAAAFLGYLFIKNKALSWYGGITGDVLGASVEGVEISLWMIVWLLHYFATA